MSDEKDCRKLRPRDLVVGGSALRASQALFCNVRDMFQAPRAGGGSTSKCDEAYSVSIEHLGGTDSLFCVR